MATQEQSARSTLSGTTSATTAATAAAQEKEPGSGITIGKVLRYLAVALIVFVAVAPFYWTLATSLKEGFELNASPPTLVPRSPTLGNYNIVLTNQGSAFFRQDLINSTIVATTTTILCLIFGSIAAYAIARLKFRFKGIVLAAILSVNMFPFIALVAPLYVFFTNTNLYDTYLALIIPDLVVTMPLTIWLLVSFFKDLPPDLEEAALVDGATRLQALRKIIVPLTAPGVFAAAILSFIATWNDFLFGLTMTSQNAQPVTVGITRFNGQFEIPWGQIAAAAVIVTIPLVILVLIFQRRIVSGLTAGAVKG